MELGSPARSLTLAATQAQEPARPWRFDITAATIGVTARGPGNSRSSAGGRTRLWLNDRTAHCTDVAEAPTPAILVRFSFVPLEMPATGD